MLRQTKKNLAVGQKFNKYINITSSQKLILINSEQQWLIMAVYK